MGTYQQLFKRYEKKYTLTGRQYELLKVAMADHMTLDHYGKHLIQNVYYDTAQFDLIRQSIEKPLYKEKLRLRCYGETTENAPVYIEIKKKYKGVVYKRRIQLPYKIAFAYLERHLTLMDIKPYLDKVTYNESLQVLNEIEWMIKRHGLQPKVYIGYEREAYKSNFDPDFRITFDSNLSFRQTALTLEPMAITEEVNQNITKEPLWLMEVKASQNMPLWFVQILSDLSVYPSSFSKYGECYKAHLAPSFIHQLAVSRPQLLRTFEQPSIISGGHLYA